MGYTTDFEGNFKITPTLKPEHKQYLEKFSDTRRYKRDAIKTVLREDPIRLQAELPVGKDGGYFVGEVAYRGQGRGVDLVDYNGPPAGQPSLWCQWVPDDDGTHLEWDGGEKFYDYVEWLEYLIEHFFGPWGYVLNGEVEWYGEDRSDVGKIIVIDNEVTVKQGRIEFD
jgi:hypothetical protein